MNGPSTIYFAESMAKERARRVEQRAAEPELQAGLGVDHPLRARIGNGLIKIGMWLAPRPAEPHRTVHTSPSC